MRLSLPLLALFGALLFPFAAFTAEPAPFAGGADINVQMEADDADAQFERGRMLLRAGRAGNREALTESVTWFCKSADQGHAGSAYFAGFAFYSGTGVAKDYTLARRYLNIAAAKGNTSAMFTLAHMYLNGEGVPQSDVLAAEWLIRAAEKGSDNAQSSLALLYAEGRGVPRDGAKAVELARKAIGQGNLSAMYNLGIIYAKGGALPLSAPRALYWLRMAASRGHSSAAAALGGYYYKGLGPMKPDPVQAAIWLQAALEMNRNSKSAFDQYMKLAPTLTNAQARAAKNELARWETRGIPAPTGPEPQ